MFEMEDAGARARHDNGPEEDSDARRRREKAASDHALMKSALSRPTLIASWRAGDVVELPIKKREPAPAPSPRPNAPAQPLRPAAVAAARRDLELLKKMLRETSAGLGRIKNAGEQVRRTQALRDRFHL